jgi:hypothetical protein
VPMVLTVLVYRHKNPQSQNTNNTQPLTGRARA